MYGSLNCSFKAHFSASDFRRVSINPSQMLTTPSLNKVPTISPINFLLTQNHAVLQKGADFWMFNLMQNPKKPMGFA